MDVYLVKNLLHTLFNLNFAGFLTAVANLDQPSANRLFWSPIHPRHPERNHNRYNVRIEESRCREMPSSNVPYTSFQRHRPTSGYLRNCSDRCRDYPTPKCYPTNRSPLVFDTDADPLIKTRQMGRSLSDDSLSICSQRRRRRRRRHKKSSAAAVFSSSAEHQPATRYHDTTGDHADNICLIASPISPCDSDAADQWNMNRSDPDLLASATMRPFWGLPSPTCSGPLHSSPQYQTTPPSSGQNNAADGTGNNTSTLQLQSDDSPGSMLPAAPAASPVSSGAAAVSLPPPRTLAGEPAAGTALHNTGLHQLHSMAECGSNPDSGYDGSKIYRNGKAGKSGEVLVQSLNRRTSRTTSESDCAIGVVDVVPGKSTVPTSSVPDVVKRHSELSEKDKATEILVAPPYSLFTYNHDESDLAIFSPIRQLSGMTSSLDVSPDDDQSPVDSECQRRVDSLISRNLANRISSRTGSNSDIGTSAQPKSLRTFDTDNSPPSTASRCTLVSRHRLSADSRGILDVPVLTQHQNLNSLCFDERHAIVSSDQSTSLHGNDLADGLSLNLNQFANTSVLQEPCRVSNKPQNKVLVENDSIQLFCSVASPQTSATGSISPLSYLSIGRSTAV